MSYSLKNTERLKYIKEAVMLLCPKFNNTGELAPNRSFSTEYSLNSEYFDRFTNWQHYLIITLPNSFPNPSANISEYNG